jgi:GAF domain
MGQEQPQHKTWRDILRHLDAKEKQCVVREMGIERKTLDRRIHGQTTMPHLKQLRQLLASLSPDTRTHFIEAIQQDPHFAKYMSELSLLAPPAEIPSAYYAQIMRTFLSTPQSVRFTAISHLALLQAIGLLDREGRGSSITILKCTSPSQGNKVRTLSQQCTLGTFPWSPVIEQHNFFLGAESLAGHAVMTQKACTINDVHTESRPTIHQVYQDEYVKSMAAVPLQAQGSIAGCVLVLSTQPNFFTPVCLALIQHYCDLITLAINEDELYELQQIALDFMPPISVQKEYCARFREQVSQLIRESQHVGSSRHWLEIEREVRQCIETALVERKTSDRTRKNPAEQAERMDPY